MHKPKKIQPDIKTSMQTHTIIYDPRGQLSTWGTDPTSLKMLPSERPVAKQIVKDIHNTVRDNTWDSHAPVIGIQSA